MENLFVNEVKLTYTRTGLPKVSACSSGEVCKVLRKYIDPDVIDLKEHFFLICVSSKNEVLNISTLSIGGLTTCIVDKRGIIQTALLSNCRAIIVAHNHPSGNPSPSSQDIKVTNEIKEAAKLFDIEVMDHIIITSDSYYSFADEGIL